MKPKINYIVLGVDNLARAVEFYKAMGLTTEGIVASDLVDELTGAYGTICFFHLQNDLLFCLYERTNLAKDASIDQESPSSSEFSLGYMVVTKNEVAKLLKRAKLAGGVVTDEPHKRPWGVYSAYFKDLDGHLWEVTYDPRIKLA